MDRISRAARYKPGKDSPSMSSVVTGRLEYWTMAGNLIFGAIYNDAQERFPDGFVIMTSSVQTYPGEVKEGAIVETKNSRYLLGKHLP